MKSTGIKVTQSQRLQLNTALQASIRLLQADAAGLTRYLEEQAAENPAIRLDYVRPSPGDWLPRWSGVLPQGSGNMADRIEGPAPGLIAHVTAQIAGLGLSPAEARIAVALVEALEPSGWLGSPVATIAADLGRPIEMVEAVLTRVQRIDPPGIFARDLRDCLRLQVEEEGIADPPMLAVLHHLDLLAKGETARLARLAGITEAEVEARFRLIRRLDPKPGARFAAHAAPVREPDLLLQRTAAGWEVSLNRSALPSLSVAEGRGPGRAAARALSRLVANRNATLLRVGQEILRRQQRALEEGLSALVPMTMAELGRALDLHESTISRIVAGVSLDTPRGTWWLRSLFGGARGSGDDGPAPSVPALRARLSALIAAENATRPLSDAALALALAEGGAVLSRRSVADYRKALDIPPAHARRKPASGTRPRAPGDRKGRSGA